MSEIRYISEGLMSCAEVEVLLDAYIDGEMDLVQRQAFERHLTACEQCSNLVADCQMIVETARSMGEIPLPEGVSDRLRQRLEVETGVHFSRTGNVRGVCKLKNRGN